MHHLGSKLARSFSLPGPLACNKCVPRWRFQVLPAIGKIWLTLGAFAMALSFAMFNFGACFRPFVITSKIGDPYELGGLNGNV